MANSVVFTVWIEIDEEQKGITTIGSCEQMLSDMEEVVAKKGYSLYDSTFSWEEV